MMVAWRGTRSQKVLGAISQNRVDLSQIGDIIGETS